MKKNIFISLIFITFLWGHNSVHHRIDRISHQIKHSAMDTTLYIKRAELYIEAKHYDEAKKDLDIASQDKKKYLITQFYFAKILFLRHQYLKSEENIRYLIDNYPQNNLTRTLYQQLIDIYLASNQEDKAILTYENFIKNIPTLIEVNDYFILSNLLIKKKKYTKALIYLNEAINKFGKLSLFIDKRIEIYNILKEYQKAINDIEVLIQMKQRLPYLYMQKGQLHQKMKNYKLALNNYKKSLQFIQKMSTRQQNIPIIKKLKKQLLEDIKYLE